MREMLVKVLTLMTLIGTFFGATIPRNNLVGNPNSNNFEKVKTLWILKVGNTELEQPCISQDGSLYFACNGLGLLALSPSGKVRWRTKGFCSFPTAPSLAPDEDVLAWTSTGLTCFSPEGVKKWVLRSTGATKEVMVGSQPAVTRSGSIFLSNSAGELFKIDINGKLMWKMRTGTPSNTPLSPSVGSSGIIYFAPGNSQLYAVSQAGARLWNFGVDSSVISSLATDANGNALISTSSGFLVKVSSTGHELWRLKFKDPVAISNDYGSNSGIYASDGQGRLYSVSSHGVVNWATQAGNSRWAGPHPSWPPFTTASIPSSPTVDKLGNIYFKSPDGSIHIVSPRGKFLWSYQCSVPLASSISVGRDGTFYAATGGSHHDVSYIYAFKLVQVPTKLKKRY